MGWGEKGGEERGRRVSTTDPFNSLSIEVIAKLRIKLQRLSPLHFFPSHTPTPPPFFFFFIAEGEGKRGVVVGGGGDRGSG